MKKCSKRKSKYSSMTRHQLEEAAYDVLSLSMEYGGEDADIWKEIETTPTDQLIAFLEDE